MFDDQDVINNLTKVNTDDIAEQEQKIDFLFHQSELMQKEIDFIKKQIAVMRSKGRLYV